MSRFVPLFVAVSLAGLSAACAPMIGSNGFQAIDAKPQDIVAGTDTKETVLARLGSPSTTSTFEPDQVWYYISQTTEKYTYNRPVAVRTLGLADGEQIAMNRTETPTRGRALTVLEQLLGNVGRGQLPRTEDDTPGQRRPD